MSDSNALSVADVAAITRNDNGWGDGNFLWFIILIFIFAGGGLWGNGRQAMIGDVERNTAEVITNDRFNILTAAQAENSKENAILIKDAQYTGMQNTNTITTAMNQGFSNVGSQLCCGFNGVNKSILESTYAETNTMNQGFNTISSDMCAGFNGVTRSLDGLKYEGAINTTAITNAIHQEGECTRAMIQANVVQDLRDRLEEKDRLYQAANFQISQQAQTQNIVGQLKPYPVPAYLTASPYTSYPYLYGTAVANATIS